VRRRPGVAAAGVAAEVVATEIAAEVAATEVAAEVAATEVAAEVAATEVATEVAATEVATEVAATEVATEVAAAEEPMSRLAVYAIARAAPLGPLGVGVAGEPLRWIPCGSLGVVGGEAESWPQLDRRALERHDQTVRRLDALVDALLPARFGETFAGEPELIDAVAGRQAELAAALDRVAGCVQMTLRVFGEPAAGGEPNAAAERASSRMEGPAVADDAAGPGTRYLAARRAARERSQSIPELADLRRALRQLVRDERLRRHDVAPLLASAHDLVGRDDVARYREICQAHRPALAAKGRRLTLSGPWPPYAFGLGVAATPVAERR
jgi:hypothetical protein